MTVSDLPEFVELMSANIDLNKDIIRGSVSARTLIWYARTCVLGVVALFLMLFLIPNYIYSQIMYLVPHCL